MIHKKIGDPGLFRAWLYDMNVVPIIPTFLAVAPASTYTLPTSTVVMRPDPPVPVTNGCPEPRSVMTGGTVSGAENISAVAAAAAATAAEFAPADMDALELLVLPPVRSAATAAASEPQYPLTLHGKGVLLLHVFSEGPHGSKTVNVRVAATDCMRGPQDGRWRIIESCSQK